MGWVIYLVEIFSVLIFLPNVLYSQDIEDDEPQLVLYREDLYRTEILGQDCAAGIYLPKDLTYVCACVTGVWAFYDQWCTAPLSIVAGHNYCFPFQHQTLKQVSLLSATNSSFGSTLVRMTRKKQQLLEKYNQDANVKWSSMTSSFVVVGSSSWNLETAQGKSYCLRHTNPNEICFTVSFTAKPIRKIQRGCKPDAELVEPQTCSRILRSLTDDEEICSKQAFRSTASPKLEHYEVQYSNKIVSQKQPTRSRVKREDPPADPAAASPAGGGAPPGDPAAGGAAAPAPPAGNSTANDAAATEDEDFVDPSQTSVKNNPIIMDQLKTYLDGSINDVTGASPYSTSTRFPIFDLLDLTAKVMASTCAIVSADHFRMAVNTFINIQTHSLQVREPYMSEPTFKRIKDALNECLLTASAYNFVYDDPDESTSSSSNSTGGATAPPANKTAIICEGDMPPNATHSVLRDDAVMNISMPVVNAGAGFEPIIETVWKTFLNTHNYCYRKFSEFYNDHHSFTVGLLNFFTNDIQNMWYPVAKNGTWEEPPAGGKLYGGLIGDHTYLLANIDLCVAASRIGSPYPWLMLRPPKDETNKWSRRKRSTMVSHGEVCLTSPTDIYTKVDHPLCK